MTRSTHPAPAPTSSTIPDAVRGRAWLPFLLGFVLLWGTLAGLGAFDVAGRWGLPILAGVAVVALLVDRWIMRTTWRSSIRHLGLSRPGWRPMALAAAVSVLVLLIYPITMAVTGASFAVSADWPWLLIGLLAFNGIAEELAWRGYTFRRLRAGRSFAAAVLRTMPLVAASHIPIVVTSGPVVGIGAMLVAAVTSIPFAYLYEGGRGTIWAPALVHSAIDSFKLFVMPPSAVLPFSLLLIVVSLSVPLLALCVRRSALAPGPHTSEARR